MTATAAAALDMQLSPALRALDRLVAEQVIEPRATAMDDRRGDPLGETARMLCDEARHVDPRRAEWLVVALHRSWPVLPAVRRLPPDETRQALLATVVSACIRRFYDADGGEAGARRRA